MDYSSSAECHVSVIGRVGPIGIAISDVVNRPEAKRKFDHIDLKIRYTPIIMPPDWLDKYTDRTKVRKKQRILDCAPQLDYNKFREGSYEDSVLEFVSGIDHCLSLLGLLGVSDSSVGQIKRLFRDAAQKIIVEPTSDWSA
jgi:hypothetical protein